MLHGPAVASGIQPDRTEDLIAIEKVRQQRPGVPVIVFARGAGAGHKRIGEMTKAECLGVETSMRLDWARERVRCSAGAVKVGESRATTGTYLTTNTATLAEKRPFDDSMWLSKTCPTFIRRSKVLDRLALGHMCHL